MNKTDVVLIWLSLQLAACSFFWMKAEKKLSYLEGQRQIWAWASEAEDGCKPHQIPNEGARR